MARECRSKESSYIAGSVSRAGRRRTRSTVVNTDTGIRVGSAVSGSLAGSMRMTATLQGPQGSIAATVLFDTGASANVVAQRWVHQSGLTSLMTNATSAVQFVFANGERAWSTKELPSAVLQLGEFNERIALRVAPKMLDDVDIILGLPWFRRRNPQVDWVSGSMLVGSALILGARHGDESHVQQPRTSQPIPIATLGADDMRQLLLQ